MAKMGRPKKDSPDRTQAVIDAVARGMTYVDACRIAQISGSTFKAWKRNNVSFLSKLKEAEASFKDSNVKIIMKAAKRNWTAAAWLLERKHNDEWGRKSYLKAESSVSGRLSVTLNIPGQEHESKKNERTEETSRSHAERGAAVALAAAEKTVFDGEC